MDRIARLPVASVYPLYVTKVERKGRTEAEVRQVVEWLTGLDGAALDRHLEAGTTFGELFDQVQVNPRASAITGTVCGVRVETIEDSFMQKVRYLDKLVDELAKGRPMEKVLRS